MELKDKGNSESSIGGEIVSENTPAVPLAKKEENENQPETNDFNENVVVSESKKGKNKEVLFIGNPEIAKTDLQSSFLKFRQQKMRERQLMKACQQVDSSTQQRSEEYKNALRAKFIERAKSYLGVPYARRFQDPSIPEAPLYLDCCALVRKCVQDLSDEFGFIIGRWNQAYQMDTLPIILKEEDLKPGDLIFYEGTYNSKRSKPQKHNNVHVEIFLGGETGESTVGSRFYKGVVSIFPSYKFTSTSWTLVKHHFRSLDTWLNGVCKSCCPEHPWASDSLAYLEAAGKRSIFSDEHETRKETREEDDDDVRADNEDYSDDEGKQKTEEEFEANSSDGEEELVYDEYAEEGEEEEGGGDGTDSDDESFHAMISPKISKNEPLFRGNPSSFMDDILTRDKSKSMNDADLHLLPDPTLFNQQYIPPFNGGSPSKSLDQLSVSEQAGSTRHTNTKQPSPKKGPGGAGAACGRGNAAAPPRNRRMLSKSLENENDLNSSNNHYKPSLIPSNSDSSKLLIQGDSVKEGINNNGSQRYKPVNKRVSKYASSSNSSSSLINESEEKTSMKAEGNPVRLGNNGRSNSNKRGIQANNTTNDEIPVINVPTNKTYFVSKSNGWRLVKAALDNRGWQQLPFEYQFSSKFGLKWVERRSQIDYRAHQPGQLVCHIPNNDIITTKTGLLTIMRDRFCSKTVPTSQRKQYPPWLPITFELESPADINALFDYLQIEDKQQNEAKTAENKDSIWIYKPSCYNRGRGIKVVSGLESLKTICYGKPAVIAPSSSLLNKENIIEAAVEPLKGIIQKYIENPLLMYINPEDCSKGYKFDIRCYLLIARTSPTTIAFYHPGYCRLALHPYHGNDLDDPFMHLTNASIQKKDTNIYQQNKDIQIQSVKAVAENMLAVGRQSSYDYIEKQLDHEIKLCMVDVMKACNNKLLKKHGYFDLLGCDFMITDDNRLYLLEINTNPALSLDNKVLEDLLPRVVDGALGLVLQTQGSDVSDLAGVHIHPENPLPSQYHLIFDEKNNWVYS